MKNDRTSHVAPTETIPSRRPARGQWKPILLSLCLIAGLLGIMAFVYREQLTPAIAVETGTVILLAQESEATPSDITSGDELLFQASGWLEPDPWPISVAVLTDGFVEDVYVKEGEAVTNGQILARLDDTDARLALDVAESTVRERQADARAHTNEAHAASARLAAATVQVQAAAARAEVATDRWARIKALPPRDTTPTERLEARSADTEMRAAHEAAQARVKEQEAIVAQLDAGCALMAARLQTARTHCDIARVALDRTVIHAETNGIVLRRYVQPGTKRRAAMDDAASATIISLYDPDHLQIRVDVPIAEAGRLVTGQPTRISTAMLPGQVFTGRVTRIVGEADIQRNTLQAKVAVHAPDHRLRPEVLCRVEFWSNRAGSGSADESAAGSTVMHHLLWVPETALADPDSAEQDIWVVDPLSGRANRRAIRVGTRRHAGYRLVHDGLRANETVATEGAHMLEEGRRIKATKGDTHDE